MPIQSRPGAVPSNVRMRYLGGHQLSAILALDRAPNVRLCGRVWPVAEQLRTRGSTSFHLDLHVHGLVNTSRTAIWSEGEWIQAAVGLL